ncbi:class I SAM-dependent methyltransferase [Telmatocola sphagniphila]|uniref:Class I SAM-dependent methyltransferase n=1 Tax=Telmatocola sphagniphila TaxID=1123043 RepID=A0A8E6EVV4_9BACT|nr:class I SAM-dependent methyltransferase [Telmatocola sphagniphila]QVL33097.1 class I SAM-dependent methyltransferase [Telmatocola sphagniphila]
MVSALQVLEKVEGSVSVNWQDVPCPGCRSQDAKLVLEAPDLAPPKDGLWFAVVQCKRCGLHYTNPRPDEKSIADFYAEDYRPHRKPQNSRRNFRNWYPLGALRGRASERRGLAWQGNGRLLDFGCGGGSFLARMADQGWKVEGVDFSEKTVEMIRDKLGLKVHHGTLPHPELQPASFDVITMWHSLEHVHDPMEVLAEAYRLLAPEGRLLIAVPNIKSWQFKWFGKAWFALDLPRHLTHFCPKTLRLMLELNGFQVENLRGIKHADWLRSSAKLATRIGQKSYFQKLFRYKLPSRLAAWICYMFGKSDCMLAIAIRPK